MSPTTFNLSGTIRNVSNQALPNLRIEAWDKDMLVDDFLGEALSDQNGNFTITFRQEYYKELFLDKKADIYFKIYAGSKLIFSTENTILWNIENSKSNLEIIMDYSAEDSSSGSSKGKIVFSGFVKHSNGNAIEKIKVVLSEYLLRAKNKLSQANTDAKGYYSITIDKLPQNTAYIAEVVDDKGKVLASSEVIFNSNSIISQDFTIIDERYKGEDAFRLRQPILKKYFEQLKEGKEKKPLNVEDVYFVANQTGTEPRDTFHWLRANELAEETKISAEAFYGMFKQGLPTDPKALSSISGKEIKDALEKASAATFVSNAVVEQADKMVEQWNEYIVEKALEEVPNKMDASLGKILGVAIPEKSLQKQILSFYLAHEGTIEQFWNKLPEITGEKKSAEKIQTALKLGVLSGNQPDVMEALLNRNYKSENVFHELAAMDKEEWTIFLKDLSNQKNKSVVPSFIESNEEHERIEKYAGHITRMLENNLPTHSFFGKLAKQNNENSAFASPNDLVKFFDNNPFFDLKKTATVSLLEENSNYNFDGIENTNLLAEELQSIQRLSAYTSDFNILSAMKKDGMAAAFNIVSIPRNTFLKTYSQTFGSMETAQLIYQKAEKNYMHSAMIWAKAHPNLTFKTTTTREPLSDPALRTMFGSLDACECEHCTSVFSPAAYYTDILNFLYSRTPDVYNELIRKRPDLVHIELSCENTNTPLPYIDLVNELLENYVLTHKIPAETVPGSYQTTWQAKELAANPEHINYTAYDELKQAVYPHLLPFNLAIEESRVYLNHLGVQKLQLMATFFAGSKEEAFIDFNINMERLNITLQEGRILSGETTGADSGDSGLWNFYGFDKATGFKPLTDPADSSKQISGGSWDTALTGRVDVFLQQVELSYKEAIKLLLCNTINPVTGTDGAGREVRAINIVSIDGDNASCQLDNLTLTGVTTSHLQRIHRFLRLYKKLGWDMYELDKAATALNLDFGNNISQNKSGLTKISQTEFFRKHLKLPLESMLAFWSNIGTNSYIDYSEDNYPIVQPLYKKLFGNKAVLNPIDPAFSDPASLRGTLDNHTATILAALEISDEDYGYLKEELPDNNLTLANLSMLYRHAVFAKKLKMKIKDFASLKKLIGVGTNPFASPVSTFNFLLKADTVKASGFSIDQLNYILRHDYLKESSVAPTDDDISVFLSELRSSLRAIENSSAEEQQNTIIQKFSEKLKITSTASALLLQVHLKGITHPTYAMVEDFRSNDFSSFNFLKKYTDSSDTLNPKDYEPVFVRENPLADLTLDAEPDLFNGFMRLEKIATIITKLKLSDSDLENILVNSAALQCIDLSLLPLSVTAGEFLKFETLVKLIMARDTMPVGTPDFFDILLHAISSPDKTKWLDDLVLRTNWDRATIEALVGNGTTLNAAGILRTNFPADFVNGDLILKVKNCIATLTKIGLSTSLIEAAIAADFDSTVSDSIKNAAKAKYDEAQWLKVAKMLRDELREKQREALVAFVISHANFNPAQRKFERWKNSEELYEYMLIDVEMKPVSMTSRIKQAICSVQLFIDRVLLNLEHPNSNPAVSPLKLEGDQVEEWKEWRKIYRVWEANRKIFLYPENWLEPELRDDKSPFFKDVETLLKQNELTKENVEDAFHAYLEKLDEVARLEVVGLYHQVETGLLDEDDIDILHVFARTYANPHKYFHRTLENGEWTAWEALEIDVDGNHIVPVIFNRKLCLFWLFFTQDSEENTSLTDPTPRYWKIQVAWSEYRKNKWTAKKMSAETLESERFTTNAALENYKRNIVLRHWIDDAGNELAEAEYDGKLHLYLAIDGESYIQDVQGWSVSFIFDNTNTDPYLVKESMFSSFVLPEGTDYDEQMIKSEAVGNNLSLRIVRVFTTPSGSIAGRIETLDVLNESPHGKFKLVIPTNEISPYENHFFFQDKTNTFFVTHSLTSIPSFDYENYGIGDWYYGIRENWNDFYFNNILIDHQGTESNSAWEIDEYFKNPVMGNHEVSETFIEERTIELNGVTVNIHGRDKAKTENTLDLIQPLRMRSTTDYFNSSKGYGTKQSDLKIAGNIELLSTGIILATKYKEESRFTFTTFYHSHLKTFIKELYKHGIKGLLTRNIQTQEDTILFRETYAPEVLVSIPYPTSRVDFTYGSTYSQYNWELFFHVPMLIACRLKDDQRFEEAREWFHFIFNPTNSEGGDKERFWQFKPFYDEAGSDIETLDELLKNEDALTEQVNKWMADPFKPHVIARIRINAYMKNVVMKYLDNMIAWGDNLFKRDTIETINEATNLYILAAKILGERPAQIPPRAIHDETTFDQIKDDLDAFSNAMVQIETMMAPSAPASSGMGTGSSSALGKMSYFCVPGNEFLLKYWDTIADRLFKIRHSMNMEGVVRTLPLFEPPIDPAMLIRAAAAGMDLSSILSDMNVELPHYRFSFMLQKANEFTNDVKALGSAILQTLEKRDGEALALLRSAHEQRLLNAILSIKESQVNDAKEQVEAIKKSKEMAQLKYDYYSSRPFMNTYEKQQLNSIQLGMIFSVIQGGLNTIGGVLSAIPNLKIGAPTSMGATWGGDNLGSVMNAISTYMGIYAAINNAQGSMAGTFGGYTRRMDDWTFQSNSTSKELELLEKQIISTEIKVAIAEKERQNHQLQIEHSEETDEFMRSKFTNQQLYDWMVGQLSTVYFQSYQLAYDLAKKAEQCYQYELGEYGNSSFIQFGYWDSLKKGLLSAEKLQYDLRRMESSFYEKNVRELELTKHISLFLLNPEAILALRENGTCSFIIPEAIFDLDFQGHYFRRIKSLSISIPCIAGPYTTINATLRLLKHTTRLNTSGASYKSDDYSAESDRFRHITTEVHSIASSNAQNDSGVFELNFQDARYLPFEGCGAFGEWQLELNTEATLRMFDYTTISDVIMTMRYTAKEDAGPFKTSVSEYLKNLIENSVVPSDSSSGMVLKRMFSMKQEFSTEWHKFLHPSVAESDQTLVVPFKKEHFPFLTQGRVVGVSKIDFFVKANRTGVYNMVLTATNTAGDSIISPEIIMPLHDTLTSVKTVSLPNSTISLNVEHLDIFSPLTVKFKHSSDIDYHSISIEPKEIEDVFIVVYYKLSGG